MIESQGTVVERDEEVIEMEQEGGTPWHTIILGIISLLIPIILTLAVLVRAGDVKDTQENRETIEEMEPQLNKVCAEVDVIEVRLARFGQDLIELKTDFKNFAEGSREVNQEILRELRKRE